MATDDDKREEGSDNQGHGSSAELSAFFLFACISLGIGILSFILYFLEPNNRTTSQARLLLGVIFVGAGVLGVFPPATIKRIYKERGFTPFALGLIALGLLICPIFYSMDVPRPGESLLGWLAIRTSWQWSLIIGIGYFLFKLLLLGISQASKAAKIDSSEAAPPQAQATTPTDDLKARLLRLEDLHNEGLLTDAEYQAKREEILGEV